MKKILLITALIAAFNFSAISVKAQNQGDMLADVFYGFPDLYGATLEGLIGSTVTGIDLNAFPPIGGKFEYMVTDKIGLGAIIGYASNSISYTDPSFGTSELGVSRLRAMLSFNAHFGSSDTFDPYWMLGAGYASLNISASGGGSSITVPTPSYALRTAFGTRYFFSDMLGAHLEIGFGSGAIFQAGVSAKF